MEKIHTLFGYVAQVAATLAGALYKGRLTATDRRNINYLLDFIKDQLAEIPE